MVGARQSPVDLAVLVVAEVVWVGLVPCASLGDEGGARGNGLSHEGGFGGGGKDFGGDDSPEDGFDVGRLKDGSGVTMSWALRMNGASFPCSSGML